MMFSQALRQLTRCSAASLRRLPAKRRVLNHALASISVAAQRHRRMMSTPAPQINSSTLSIDAYNTLSDSTMDTLLESLEELLDEAGVPEYEVDYHAGVLTLILGDKGTYVINKQPPNKQIWLSSPFSGPKRYDYSAGQDDWIYTRDNRALGELLNEELSQVFRQKIELGATHISALAGV
ncbi:hypothetical protein BDQ12DRAFT_626819 [Crucibulum laeve]|uniref:ferroxidase n=1 Tax=Crucibulum laeve TaxID=68775 RepID=A0A5C3M7K8_9AGAR|nr:hypothetical protein BDQ12DRAFT_626819 [Crucibulum laeve]